MNAAGTQRCFLALFLLCAAESFCSVSQSQDSVPLRHAHAHNDYLHDRPLLDALSHGFCSVEADVFLVGGELLVAHTRFGLKPDRSLKKLYLDPLRERVQENDGRVFRDGPVFTLLIDIKADGAEAYRVLSRLLAEYPKVFSQVKDGKLHEKAVTVIISGDRAKEVIRADSPRFAGIDGRLSDLESDAPAHELPLISDHWGRNFGWRGAGEMSEADQLKLTRITKKAHAKGRRVRFWAIPDKPAVWGALRDAGVDLINTDKLKELSDFLR